MRWDEWKKAIKSREKNEREYYDKKGLWSIKRKIQFWIDHQFCSRCCDMYSFEISNGQLFFFLSSFWLVSRRIKFCTLFFSTLNNNNNNNKPITIESDMWHGIIFVQKFEMIFFVCVSSLLLGFFFEKNLLQAQSNLVNVADIVVIIFWLWSIDECYLLNFIQNSLALLWYWWAKKNVNHRWFLTKIQIAWFNVNQI